MTDQDELALDVNGRWDYSDLEDLTTDELVDLKSQVDITADDIDLQIQRAKVKAHSTGEYADPDWFINAKTALKHMRRKRQMLQNYLGQRRREERKLEHQERQSQEGYWFKEYAREILDENTFTTILRLAERRTEAEAV